MIVFLNFVNPFPKNGRGEAGHFYVYMFAALTSDDDQDGG